MCEIGMMSQAVQSYTEGELPGPSHSVGYPPCNPGSIMSAGGGEDGRK